MDLHEAPLTRQSAGPTEEPVAGLPDRAGTSGGSSPPRSSLSRDSGGQTVSHICCTPCSAWLSLVAVREKNNFTTCLFPEVNVIGKAN